MAIYHLTHAPTDCVGSVVHETVVTGDGHLLLGEKKGIRMASTARRVFIRGSLLGAGALMVGISRKGFAASELHIEISLNVAYLKELLRRSKDAGVVNHLLMVDDEGPLATTDERARLSAVENHKKWVEAATVYNSGGVKTRTRRFKGTI